MVVTGYGALTPLGDASEYVEALLAGRSAVRYATDNSGAPVLPMSRIESFDPKPYVQPRKTLKLLSIEAKFSFAAVGMACEKAGISQGSVDPDRLGGCFGCEMVFSEIFETIELLRVAKTGSGMDYKVWANSFVSHIYPLWMLKGLPNMASCHASIQLDARGPINSIASDEIGGMVAIQEAYLQIRRGRADVMLAGGCSTELSPTRLIQVPQEHYAASVPSGRDVSETVRPFAADRVGAVRSEGAACVILERRSHALARGAKPLATLLATATGWGRPSSYRQGSAAGYDSVTRQAIERAGVAVDRIDHFNTPGCGSPTRDAAIADGLTGLAAGRPIMAVQGATGSMGNTTSLCELVASLEAAYVHRRRLGTMHCEPVDPAFRGICVEGEFSRPLERDCFVKVSQTPYGQTAATVWRIEE